MTKRAFLALAGASALLLGTPSPAPAKTFTLAEATVDDIQAAMDAGALTSVELTTLYLNRIAIYDRAGIKLNAVVALDPTQLAQAAASDARRAAGAGRGPLEGVPFSVKAIFDVAGLPSTSGNAMFASALPPGDAESVARLRAAGVVIQGQLNLDDFADGNLTNGEPNSSLFGPAHNAYDLTQGVSGSSGGSGLAAAANLTVVALGSETYGSTAGPATANSVVGYRPTQGAVTLHGVYPNQIATDDIGILARHVKDAAYATDAMKGRSESDYMTTVSGGELTQSLVPTGGAASLAGKRIGIFRQHLQNSDGSFTGTAAGQQLFDESLATLRALGAVVVEVTDIPYDVEHFNLDTRLFNDFLDASYGQAGFAGSLNAKRRYFDALGEPKATFEFFLDNWYQYWWFGGSPYSWKGPDPYTPEQRQRCIDRSHIALETDPEVAAFLSARAEVRDTIQTYMAAHELDALVYPFEGFLDGEYVADNYYYTNKADFAAYIGLSRVALPWAYANGRPGLTLDFIAPAWKDKELLQLTSAIEQAAQRRIAPALTPALPGETIEYSTAQPPATRPELAPPALRVAAGAKVTGQGKKATLIIKGGAVDASGLRALTVYVNGRKIAAQMTKKWKATVKLTALREFVKGSAKTVQVTVVAKDIYGNTSVTTKTVKLPKTV